MIPSKYRTLMLTVALLLVTVVIAVAQSRPSSQRNQQGTQERFKFMSDRTDREIAANPFVGVTMDGSIEPDLFSIRSTGVSTEPVRRAANAFLEALSPEQREKTVYDVDDDEWRKWMNQHFYLRQGVSFLEMTEEQRTAAFSLLGSGLSAKGLSLSRDIMRLNHTLGELAGDNFEEYGEWLYHVTVMGAPSATEPWGWQLDGHHLIINYFVLGDQVVMSPVFVGSEPVTAESGKFAGTTILDAEQSAGLAFVQALTSDQQQGAILEVAKDGNNNLGEALKDNLVLDYAGLAGSSLRPAQRKQLLSLIKLYVDNQAAPHAAVRMAEIERHLDRTYFAWIGATDDDAVFYYRIHSPVVLIEFDHQRPANLRHLMANEPSRQHIHAVVRTPNGNDYGKDLLRQHYLEHPHPH